MLENAIEEIRGAIPNLTPQQRKVGMYICENPDSLGALSLTDFAAKAGISGPTVTRFCRSMGYSGFLEFSRRMRTLRANEISHATYFRNARVMNAKPGCLAKMMLEKECANVRKLLETYSEKKISTCAALMHRSAALAVIGKMSAYPAAVYFEQLLTKITPKLLPMSGGDVMQAAALSRLDRNSLVFCMAFPRYPRAVVELAREAAHKGAVMVAITNGESSPLAEFCKILFTVDVEILSYIDLIGPVFALINLICLEFSLVQSGQSEKSLANYDKVVENVFFVPSRKKIRKKP